MAIEINSGIELNEKEKKSLPRAGVEPACPSLKAARNALVELPYHSPREELTRGLPSEVCLRG